MNHKSLTMNEDIENYLNEHKKSFDLYIRVLAVQMVKSGKTRKDVGEYLHRDRKTVGRWVSDYDKNGIDGLIPDYSNCGVECRLTDEQLADLKEKLRNPDVNYTIEDARKLIKNEYGVDYSYKQTWEIVLKKLGFASCRPFIVYDD